MVIGHHIFLISPAHSQYYFRYGDGYFYEQAAATNGFDNRMYVCMKYFELAVAYMIVAILAVTS